MKSLVDVEDCVLVVIDVQDHFLARLPRARAYLLVDRVGWIIEVAKVLKIPIVVTAEEKERYADVPAVISGKLPPGTEVFDKTFFGLAGQKNILEAVHRTGRKTAVLVGMETDVCVAQSALGLMQSGFQVAVLADATDSPGDAHSFGLDRITKAGALVMSLKGLYYEWVRTVPKCNEMDDEHLKRIGLPAGILL